MAVNTGDFVTVRAFGGELLRRVVVKAHPRGVLVCRPEEWAAAKREGRNPSASGFPWEDVVLEDREQV